MKKKASKKLKGSKSMAKVKALRVVVEPLNPQPLPPRNHPII
jgi:hypothetical protein